MVKLSLSVSEWSTEWRATVFTDSEISCRVGDARRRPSDRTATRHGRPGEASHDVHTPTRLPDLFANPKFHFFAPPRAASELSRSTIIATELRRRRACKPPQKHELRLHHSSAVSSSTFSTS